MNLLSHTAMCGGEILQKAFLFTMPHSHSHGSFWQGEGEDFLADQYYAIVFPAKGNKAGLLPVAFLQRGKNLLI